MATISTQLDLPGVRERVLEVLRGLLEELGSQGAIPQLSIASNLDRDLGLGSLERVELLTRLENAFDVRLPDTLAAEASTPEELIQAILTAPGTTVSEEEETSVLPASAAVQVMQREAEDSIVEKAETLIDVIRHRGIHDADRAHLLITEDDEQGEHHYTLTFGELYTAAQKCAEELARRGVPAGGRVSLMLPTSRQFFICYTGILLAGAIPVPIYPPYRADRIEEYAQRQSAILNNARVCLLLTFRRAEAVAKLLKPRVKSLLGVVDARKLLEAAEKEPPAAPGALPAFLSGSRMRKGSDIALLQYTSGSTGDPKGVVLTHANLLANMRALAQAVQLGPGDVAVSWLPLYHDMGLVGFLLTPLACQVSVDLLPTREFARRPLVWLDLISRNRGTLAYSPSFGYELCTRRADSASAELDLSCWRGAGIGGDMIRPQVLEKFSACLASRGFRPEAFVASYGMAEATLALSFAPVGRGIRKDIVLRRALEHQGFALPCTTNDAAEGRAFVCCGPILPGHRLEVRDEGGRVLPERRVGTIFVRGPSIMLGYDGHLEETMRVLSAGGWFNTGDLGYVVDGEIVITGRAKDLIIVNGRNIWPQDLEWTAETELPTLRSRDVVVFSVDDDSTERVIALVQCRATDPEEREALRMEAAGLFRRQHGIEVSVLLVPPHSLPQTSSGKLSRTRAKQMLLSGAFDAEPRISSVA